MNKSIPTRIADATLVYCCTYCQAENLISAREAQQPNFRFYCSCGTINHIQQVRLSFTATAIGVVKKIVNIHPTGDTIKAVKLLRTYGYKKKEAQKAIDESYKYLIQTKVPITTNNLIKQAFVRLDECYD